MTQQVNQCKVLSSTHKQRPSESRGVAPNATDEYGLQNVVYLAGLEVANGNLVTGTHVRRFADKVFAASWLLAVSKLGMRHRNFLKVKQDSAMKKRPGRTKRSINLHDRLKITEVELAPLLQDLRRDRDRLAASSLTLRFVWHEAGHPHRGKLWGAGYQGNLDGFWHDAGHFFCRMELATIDDPTPYICRIYLVGGDSKVIENFTRHCREAEAIFGRMAGDGTRFNWASFLFETFPDVVEWRENKEPGRPGTLSLIAELEDVFEWSRVLLKAFIDGAVLRQQSRDGRLPSRKEVVPPPKRGRKPATVDDITEACRVHIAYEKMGLSQKEFCEYWNRNQVKNRGSVEVGVSWLRRRLAFVRKLMREEPHRIPKEFANKMKPLRSIKRAAQKNSESSRRTS